MTSPLAYLEPSTKRAVAFIDGQNLFHCARESFGYTYPNYDVLALVRSVCQSQAWLVSAVRFYTGVPASQDDPKWNTFWSKKLLTASRQGVATFSRSLRYRDRTIVLPGGTTFTYKDGEEKGIDVRIAIDTIRMAHRREYDVALIFSQDQDLSEAGDEIKRMAAEQHRWIKVASAFPCCPKSPNQRGINNTDWIRISREQYDQCLDAYDYFAKPKFSNVPQIKQAE